MDRNRFKQLLESTIGNVKPLIMEQPKPKPGDPVSVKRLPQEIQNFVKTYGLTGTFRQSKKIEKLGKLFGYYKEGRYIGYLSVGDINTYETNKSQYNKCIERENRWSELMNSIDNHNTNEIDNAEQTLNSEFPNMDWCEKVMRIQDIINVK